MIKSELSENRPVCIDMDLFWCPWRKNEYQLKSEQQLCMVIGIDESSNIYCTDLGKKDCIDSVERIPKEFFLKGCSAVSTYSLTDANKIIDWREIVSESVEKNREKNNFFLSIHDFALEISNFVDFEIEKEGFSDENKIRLFKKLNNLAFGHIKFSIALKYLADMFNINELFVLSDSMNGLGWQWRTIRGMMLRAYYMKKSSDIMVRISDEVLNILKTEEKMANDLLNLCKKTYK